MANAEEKECFRYYCTSRAIKLRGVFESDFWDVILLQASSTEPAVFHAIAALACAQRAYAVRKQCIEASDSLSYTAPPQFYDRLALMQYNKAIKSLGTHFSNQDLSSLRVLMISCIVFASLEILRGEYNTIDIHIRNGINILRKIQHRNEHLLRYGRLLRPDSASLDCSLEEAFEQLTTYFLPFGYGSGKRCTVIQEYRDSQIFKIPPVFSSISEMKRYLDMLLKVIVDLAEVGTNMDCPLSLPAPALVRRQKELQDALSSWLRTYDISAPALHQKVSLAAGLGISLLRVHYTMTKIILDTCFSSAKETIFDSHTASFEEILSLVDDIVIRSGHFYGDGRPRICPSRNSFSIEMGCYPPLYLTALKCRVPSIRRKVIRLLESSAHREGVYDGPQLARILKMIINLEEKHFFSGFQTEDNNESLDRRGLVLPEFSRYHFVNIILPKSPGEKGTLVCKRFKHEDGEGWEVVNIEFDFNTPEN